MVTGGTHAEVSAGSQTAAATLDQLVRLTDWPVEAEDQQAELAELNLQAAVWAGNAYESLGSLYRRRDMAEARRWHALFRQRATYQVLLCSLPTVITLLLYRDTPKLCARR